MEEVNTNYWEVFGSHLANKVNLPDITNALDVGTGWGDCLIPLAKRIGSKGEIFGIDIDIECVHKARSEIIKHSLTNARVEFMDASELKFQNNYFDVITCGFLGFDDCYDFEKNRFHKDQKNPIMKELFRVLKPHGEIAFSTWKLQEDFEIVAEMTKNSLKSLGYSKEHEQGFQFLLKNAGFSKIQIEVNDYNQIYNSLDDWWKTNALISNNKIARKDEYDTYLDKYIHNGKLYFKKSVIYIKAKKEKISE